MIELSRELIAYALIGAVAFFVIPFTAITMQRRKREKLRRRGIKRYGH